MKSIKSTHQIDNALLTLAEDIFNICETLKIEPILSGSLVVLAYTQSLSLTVNDIDLACHEVDFQRLMDKFDQKGISFKLKEWHVLQVWRNNVKVEFDSLEYWMKDMPNEFETLRIGDYELKMVSLDFLKLLYQRGLDNTANQNDEVNKGKHAKLQEKLKLLNSLGNEY